LNYKIKIIIKICYLLYTDKLRFDNGGNEYNNKAIILFILKYC